MKKPLIKAREVRITIDANLTSGDYDIRYNNISHPGESMDFTEIITFMRKVFAQQESGVSEDADIGTTGQARRDSDDFQ